MTRASHPTRRVEGQESEDRGSVDTFEPEVQVVPCTRRDLVRLIAALLVADLERYDRAQ